MNLTAKIPLSFLRKKLTTVAFIAISVAAFATLGDGGAKKKVQSHKNLLSYKHTYNYKNFSLKTGYNYRGKSIISQPRTEGKYIQLNNTVATYHKGNTTYILPIKKRLILDKVKFNPAPVRH